MAVFLDALENNLSQKNIFQEMRENLTQNFSKIITQVNQRKIDLDKKVDELEIEYNNKNRQLVKDKQTLVTLRKQTEQQLTQNTLLDVQTDIFRDIDKKIQKLENDLKEHLELDLVLFWNFQGFNNIVNLINVELKPKRRVKGEKEKSARGERPDRADRQLPPEKPDRTDREYNRVRTVRDYYYPDD